MIPDPPIASLHGSAGSLRTTIDEFSVMRGVAILFVLYLHAYFTPWAVTPHWELLVLRVSHLFAHSVVPLFLFMSGFLLARDRSSGFADFARRRLHRLVVPLLVWMLAALVFEAWWRGGLSRELLVSFALFDVEGQFYYLFVLLVLTFAAYPLLRWPDSWLPRLTAGAFLVNLTAVAYYSSVPIGGLLATIAYRDPLVWLFPFISGFWLGRTRGNVTFSARTVCAAVAGMVVIAAIHLYRGETSGVYPTSYFGVTVFLFSACGLVVYPAAVRAVAAVRGGWLVLWPVEQLAPLAFAVYLVHKPYFLGVLSDQLVSSGPFAQDYLSLMLALFIVGGGSAILAVAAIDRIAPRFASMVLGVDARTPRHSPEQR